jgi:hypothetical protein
VQVEQKQQRNQEDRKVFAEKSKSPKEPMMKESISEKGFMAKLKSSSIKIFLIIFSSSSFT